MNGQITTYHLRGLTYEEFKNYPHDIQKEILRTLVREYGASRVAIARAFGIKEDTFCLYIKTHDLCDPFHKVTRMQPEDERRMTDMIRSASAEVPMEVPIKEIAEPNIPADPIELVSSAPEMVIADNALDLDLHGSIDPDVILASLRMLMSARVPSSVHMTLQY